MDTEVRKDGVRVCSVARTLDLVGEKWSLLAVREMLMGDHRFSEIARRTGAPRDILTTRLRRLEAEGLVERRRYSERPERFEYHLTELGMTLRPIVTMLRQWGDEHASGEDGPPLVVEHTCGHELTVDLVCAHCGEPVTTEPELIRARVAPVTRTP